MRKVLSIILSLVMLLSMSVTAFAVESQQTPVLLELKESIAVETSLTKKVGSASVKQAVKINGVTNYLYPTFDDFESALENLEKAIPTYYGFIKETVDLKELYGMDYNSLLSTKILPNNEAIDALDEAIRVSSISCKGTPLTAEQVALEEERELFKSFYDIYENESKNNAIISLLKSKNKNAQEELAYLLPYNNPLVEDYFSTANATRSAQYFNRTLGRQYAIDHATSPNSDEYGIASTWYLVTADCTNFASQILVAGGVDMHDSYPDETQGWWHRKVQDWHGNSYVWKHYYSAAWVGADRFVRFMGTSGNEYTSFRTFSDKLISGDHIALDKENDGDWDHMGFVCDIGSYGTYSYTVDGVQRSLYYRDFTVAQHTSNYFAWTSSSTNGWEVSNGNAKYAIVRRNSVA